MNRRRRKKRREKQYPFFLYVIFFLILEKNYLKCETLNLLTCADKRTDRKEEEKYKKKLHMSCVTCHMLRVTCHLSVTPTATATDAPPANFPTMHCRLV